MDQHDLVSALKALALELGRTPTSREFFQSGAGYESQTNKKWGGYSPLVIAAGLEPNYRTKKIAKITNQVFETSIEKHLENYEPKEQIERKPYPSIAVISDIHFPFAHKKTLERFFEYVGDTKAEWVILNGDAWDMYSHSRFPRSHNIFTPREEQAMARQMNEDLWKEVVRRSPSSQCVQLLGNHDIRPLKRVLEVMPTLEDWAEKMMKEIFSFPGVKTIHDVREELMIGDIAVFHGYRSQLGAHRDHTLLNCINGHTHHGGVVYRRVRGMTLWELNSGLAGDPEAKGLTYTPQKITTQTNGFGAVDKLGPRFIPT